MKRRKTYNKYDKSREEVNTEPKVLTEDDKKRKEEARKALALTASIMGMVKPYGSFYKEIE